ncbi:MAG: hypothetical protein BECKG1743F_GA0114225_111872, partial [Candidatus Kentron sp. G]
MQDYSKLDRLLHRIVLGVPAVGEMLFDIERALFMDGPLGKNTTTNQTGQTVFVTGLARAGTTVLMRALYGSGEFASLTYSDMPFVMAPNLWYRISRRNKKERIKSERAHGDRIQVDFDSPEVLRPSKFEGHCPMIRHGCRMALMV